MAEARSRVARVQPASLARAWPWGLAVGLAGLVAFGIDTAAEPHFADESAYIAQSFYADLWLDGARDDPHWLEYGAFDLPPLPKYLIGLSLRLADFRRPGPAAALAWYRNIDYRPETHAMLIAARRPSVILGALGCVGLYGLGVMVADRRTGVLAAALLMVNPLYRMLARRAMADVPTEALILLTAALGLRGWRRALARGGWIIPGSTAILAGIGAGLAVLAKLNGGLGLLIVLAWSILAAALPRFGARRVTVAGMALLTSATAYATFVPLNPFLTAHPEGGLSEGQAAVARLGLVGRTRYLLDHRRNVSADQQVNFGEYALRTPLAKVEALAVQGFGRFGPFGPVATDSTRRFDWGQDRGALIWAPWVAAGFAWAAIRGRRQYRAGEPPTAWAALVMVVVALAVVTAYLPLAWDRYYLSIQPGAALLAAGVAVAIGDGLIGRVRRREGARSS